MERQVAKSLASLNLHTTDSGPRLRFALHRVLPHCQCEFVTANCEELGSTSGYELGLNALDERPKRYCSVTVPLRALEESVDSDGLPARRRRFHD